MPQVEYKQYEEVPGPLGDFLPIYVFRVTFDDGSLAIVHVRQSIQPNGRIVNYKGHEIAEMVDAARQVCRAVHLFQINTVARLTKRLAHDLLIKPGLPGDLTVTSETLKRDADGWLLVFDHTDRFRALDHRSETRFRNLAELFASEYRCWKIDASTEIADLEVLCQQ